MFCLTLSKTVLERRRDLCKNCVQEWGLIFTFDIRLGWIKLPGHGQAVASGI
jgi:hypothetical protein